MTLPFDNTRRSRASQIEILRAFADRLREIDNLNDQNVVVSDQPMPKQTPPTGGKLFVTVSYGDGNFPNGRHQEFTEESRLVVAIYTCSKKDKAGRAEAKLLLDDSLTAYKRKVLSKLLVDNPSLGRNSPPWEPARVTGGKRVPMLREPATPSHCTSPLDAWSDWIGLQLSFRVVFDWDLYS